VDLIAFTRRVEKLPACVFVGYHRLEAYATFEGLCGVFVTALYCWLIVLLSHPFST
jgi:hypothetical protein